MIRTKSQQRRSSSDLTEEEYDKQLQRSLTFEQSFRKFKRMQRGEMIDEICMKIASKKTQAHMAKFGFGSKYEARFLKKAKTPRGLGRT